MPSPACRLTVPAWWSPRATTRRLSRLPAATPPSRKTCMGVVKSRGYWVVDMSISLFDGGSASPRPDLKATGAWAERRSRVAAGHRGATQPLTVASPATGLRSGRGDAVGGVRTTSEASPPWTRYRVADLYSVDRSGSEP